MPGHPTGGQLAFFGIELLLISVISYYGVKWLANVLDPTNKQKEVARKQAEKVIESLGLTNVNTLTDYEMSIAALLVDPLVLPVSWNDIGGLDSIISEIKETVVLPFKKPKLFSQSTLLSPPKGVLLYGPPGCGKTMVAKATAKEAGCRFINLDISSLTDKWYGESQKLAKAVFSLANKIQPCIIFIDEIDSFLRVRDSTDHEATAMMKAQFMSLWDGLLSGPGSEVIVMAATNRPQDIDKAILRRMPCRFHIDLPNSSQRILILQRLLAGEQLNKDVDLETVSALTAGYSGSDLKELCRLAALQCLFRQMEEKQDIEASSEVMPDNFISICRLDFEKAVDRMHKNNFANYFM
ncbi:outer mitochondrial transmembrane helix translocase isoform X1 [Hydra vulgaris]|uniref:outer mitochondrial transmembrane helix translocase isoform X1 n=1 Tax=Hydra vulgaris TaxID=6087 RepID=UPI0006411CD7|nr:outer mitochondrial transmembrane helix translocase [Hydra vulgaris]